jgi:hypothetical protein
MRYAIKKWIIPAVILVSFLFGVFIGYCTWGSHRGDADEGLAEAGRRVIGGITADHRGAVEGITRVQGNLGALTEGTDRSLEGVDRIADSLASATESGGKLSVGIERGIELTESGGEGLAELESIIRELISRDGGAAGPGE